MPTNFTPGTGRLALDRYDFQKHLNGEDFEQKAVSIVTDPNLPQFGGATNLQDILAFVANFIDVQEAAGQGFAAVGDGLDTWHAANGTVNYDNNIPALDTVLNPIFNAIINNTTIPDGYERLKYGGILFIKAGTYIVKDTINIPPGITIIGEGYGTKIVNAIRLDITTSPPTRDLGATAKPVFTVKADLGRSSNDAAVDPNLYMFSRESKIINLVICDNFVEPTLLGDLFYKLPTNITGDNPLIRQEAGSNLTLKDVKLLGRVVFTSGTIVSEASRFAIELDNSTGFTNGTHLNMETCFIDGFSQPIRFESIGSVNDHLNIKNCKIRSHGYLDSDDTDRSKNCIVLMNDNNLNMIGNDLYGNHSLFDTVAYVLDAVTPPLDTDARPRITISGNNFVVDRGTNASIVPRWITNDASLNATFYDNIALSVFGNNYSYADGFQVNAGKATLYLNSGGGNIYSPGGFGINSGSNPAGFNCAQFAVSGTAGSMGFTSSFDMSAPLYIFHIPNDDNNFSITGSGFFELAHAPTPANVATTDSDRSVIYFDGNELKSKHSDGTGAHYALDPTICGLRLTVTSGNSVGSDGNALTTLYYTPHTSGYIALYNNGWILRNTNEISVSVTSLTAATVYDVFAYWTGSAVALEFSNAWTNSTTRADALGTQNGIKVKNSDPTRRYIGTIRTISSTGTKITDGTGQRLVWNQYNRLPRHMGNWANDSSPYAVAGSSSWIEMGGGAYNMFVEYVSGESIYVEADSMAIIDSSITNNICATSIGLDTNTSNTIEFSDVGYFGKRTQVATGLEQLYGNYKGYPSAGYHKLYWIIRNNGSTNWYWNVTSTNRYVKSGMTALITG